MSSKNSIESSKPRVIRFVEPQKAKFDPFGTPESPNELQYPWL